MPLPKNFGRYFGICLLLFGVGLSSFAETPNPFGNLDKDGGEKNAFPEDDEFAPDSGFGFPAPPTNGAPPPNQALTPPPVDAPVEPNIAPAPAAPPSTPRPAAPTRPRQIAPRPAPPSRANAMPRTAPTQPSAQGPKIPQTPEEALAAAPQKPAPKLADYLELDPAVKGLEVKNFDLPDKEIKDVVTLISKWTGKNFILDNKVRGKITVIGPSQVTLQEAYQAFLSALEANGLTTVQAGKFIRIIESAEARRAPVKTYAGEYAPKDDQFITRIFQLKYINSDEVQREFRDLTTRQGKLFAYEPTNSIIITDTGSNIQRIKEILETLDVKNFETTLHVLRIKNGSAKTISEMLSEIYGEGKGGASSTGARSFRRSALERTRGGGVISKIIPDDLTNSLIVLANQAGFTQLVQLVAKLDVKVTDTGRIHVYYCEYAKAEDLAATLSALSGSSKAPTTSSRRTSTSTNNAAPGSPPGGGLGSVPGSAGPVTAELEGGVKITSDAATNSLVITANSSDYKTLKRVLRKLDIPRLQVFVETAILEITIDKNTNININTALGAPGSRGFAGGFIGDLPSITSFITGTPPEGATIPIFAGPSYAGTIGGQSVETNTFMGLINLLTKNVQSQVLSTPQIIALDNEKAEFKVQDEIPVQSTFTLTQGSTGAAAAGTGTISTLKTGIEVRLTPQVNAASRTIRLAIEQTVDSLRNNNDVPSFLRAIAQAKTSRVTNTSVVVRDQDYIMLGGLMSDKVDEAENKMPLLGDIPILGWLFKNKTFTTKKTNLVILLRPKIIGTTLASSNLISERLDKRDEFMKNYVTAEDAHKEAVGEMRDRLKKQETRGKDEPLFDYRNNQEDDDEDPKPGEMSELDKEKKKRPNVKLRTGEEPEPQANAENFQDQGLNAAPPPPPPSPDTPLLEPQEGN